MIKAKCTKDNDLLPMQFSSQLFLPGLNYTFI